MCVGVISRVATTGVRNIAPAGLQANGEVCHGSSANRSVQKLQVVTSRPSYHTRNHAVVVEGRSPLAVVRGSQKAVSVRWWLNAEGFRNVGR